VKNINVLELIEKIINKLGKELNDSNIHQNIYIIIGLNTTTIYSTEYEGKQVTVLLLESTLGINDNIKMLLAHEYTHWIRAKNINHNIFETSIGERFITEGIACNFSRKIVPNKKDSYYCIIPDNTVDWVKDNIKLIDELIIGKENDKELMYNFFYMFAKTIIPDMPVRTGYIYGFLKVKEYLEKNNKDIKDIINIKWQEILK